MKFIALLVSTLLVHVQGMGQITCIKLSGDTCTSLTLNLQAEGTSSSPYFFWHFGDPASGSNDSITITGASSQAFPTHTFTAPGIYTVCVSFQEPGFPVATICRTISIGLCCNGLIKTSDSCVQNNIPFSLLTGASVSTISWNFGDIASGINNTANTLNPTHTFTAVGTYTVTATVTAACGVFTDTTILTIVNCNTQPCTGTIVVNDSCITRQISFQVNSSYPILSVNWNFDDPTSGALNTATGTASTHQFTSTRVFNVSAIVNFNCGVDTLYTAVDIVNCNAVLGNACPVIIPNAFSPNQDNVNDDFLPSSSCAFESYELLIYNRWGQQVFKSNSPTQAWQGDYKGLACPVGVYGYLLKYKYPNQTKAIRKGDVTLMR